jgi:hypothetical protein
VHFALVAHCRRRSLLGALENRHPCTLRMTAMMTVDVDDVDRVEGAMRGI